VCETDAITKGIVDQSECIRCKKCIDNYKRDCRSIWMYTMQKMHWCL